MPPNFYYNQEDFLREKVAKGAKWSWSGVRPNPVCGFAIVSYTPFVLKYTSL